MEVFALEAHALIRWKLFEVQFTFRRLHPILPMSALDLQVPEAVDDLQVYQRTYIYWDG